MRVVLAAVTKRSGPGGIGWAVFLLTAETRGVSAGGEGRKMRYAEV